MTDTQLDNLQFQESATSRHIADAVRAVDRDNAHIGVLGTGEPCAVALVLDRPDVAKKVFGTLLECAVRVGPDWLAASAYVQADGWTGTAEIDLA
jgi:hypothetical protein